jgi:TolB-like protein
MRLFDELRRRNVIRVATAYAVVGWLVLQVADLAAASFAAPDWVMRMLIVALLLGLPLAAFLAWAYELTPEGVRTTAEVDSSPTLSGSSGARLNRLIIGGLVVALGYFVWESRFAPSPGVAASGVEEMPEGGQVGGDGSIPSIAVLPFTNMSSDPEQEYFSDGMTEELLNALAKISDLRVAARTTAFRYKGQTPDLREVGRDLGVQHILEGSVRKQGDRVRITAQLIRAESNFHLWTETYDRNLDDIFAVQEEIALAIAEALSVELDLAETQVVASRTANRRAYDLYLLGLANLRARTRLDEAVDSLKAAVELDPTFAPAWATLSGSLERLPVYLAQTGNRPTVEQRRAVFAEARAAAQRAYELAPDLPAALHAMGVVSADGVESTRFFDRALEIDPSNSVVMEDLVGNLFSFGLNDRAVELAERMVALDPMPVNILAYAMALAATADYPRALPQFARAAALDSTFGPILWFGADAYLLAGDLDGLGAHASRFADTAPERSAALLRNAQVLRTTRRPDGSYPPEVVDRLSGDQQKLIVAALAGATDRAVAWADEGIHGTFVTVAFEMAWIFDDPRFAELRRSPEFNRWMREDGFLEFWTEYGFPSSCRPVGEDDVRCE